MAETLIASESYRLDRDSSEVPHSADLVDETAQHSARESTSKHIQFVLRRIVCSCQVCLKVCCHPVSRHNRACPDNGGHSEFVLNIIEHLLDWSNHALLCRTKASVFFG